MTDPVTHVTSPYGWITAGSTAFLALLGGGAGISAVIIAWIKTRNPLRKMNIDAEERMREELSARLKEAEDRREAERADFQNQIKELQEAREADRMRFENEMRILRHRANNSDHAVDMLLALLEADPSKVADTVEKVKALRAEQDRIVAMEKGYVMAAREASA